MCSEKEDIELLTKHFPDKSVDFVYNKIIKHNVLFKINRPRSTKLGDYMPPTKYNYHKISVNANLNKYAFLITFLHELAHLETWLIYKNKVNAHGKEWVAMFKNLIIDIDYVNIFPNDISSVINNVMVLPKGFAGNYKTKITKILSNYNIEKDITLGQIGSGFRITLYNGRQFDVLEKIRTRYKCKDIHNGKMYIVSANAQIVKFNKINV